MIRFDFATTQQIRFGRGRLADLGDLAAGMGHTICLVTAGGWMESSGRLGEILDQFRERGLQSIHVRMEHEPTVEAVDAAAEAARRAGADAVVAVGGGAVMDTGKAIAALLGNGGATLDYLEGVGRGKPLDRPCAPLIAAPTTAGTGSEATKNAVIGNAARTFKKSMRGEGLLPRVALVDPALTDDCPPLVTAASGLDAVTQILEAFIGRGGSPMTEALALAGLSHAGAIARVVEHPDDTEARDSMALASLLGGICLANAGLGAVHGLASALGAFYPAPHGVVCARLLPGSIRATAAHAERTGPPDCLEKYGQAFWQLFGVTAVNETASPEALARRLEALNEQYRLPRLGEFGVKVEDFERILKNAGGANLKNNPVELSHDELIGLLESAL